MSFFEHFWDFLGVVDYNNTEQVRIHDPDDWKRVHLFFSPSSSLLFLVEWFAVNLHIMNKEGTFGNKNTLDLDDRQRLGRRNDIHRLHSSHVLQLALSNNDNTSRQGVLHVDFIV